MTNFVKNLDSFMGERSIIILVLYLLYGQMSMCTVFKDWRIYYLEVKSMKSKKGLYSEILKITILPILLLGTVITILCVYRFTRTIYNQVEKELKDIALAVINTYDIMYPGDYVLTEKEGVIEVYKGDKLISGNHEYIDCLKEDTGIDITIFYYNTRILTTLHEDNKRMVGTSVSNIVEREVLEKQNARFYKSVDVGKEEFFAYYKPIYNKDKECIGMVFTGKPVKYVNGEIRSNLLPIIAIAILVLGLMSMLYFYYTKVIIRIIKKLQEFMGDISKGELYSELDDYILKRNDEIGLIGQSAVEMQKSLKVFVEQDVLTKINNRRCGERLLDKTISEVSKNGGDFVVAIGDIDWFKKVNDNYGHECGDVVLQKVANILKKSMLDKGYVARWGGEEFLIVFENSTLDKAYEILVSIADKIRSEKIFYDGREISVTMTFGMAKGIKDKAEYNIIKEADDKLYEGKNTGRDKIVK